MVGTDPESGDEITAQNGRYGPYQEGHRLPVDRLEDKFSPTITLEEALAIYAEPKRRGRAAADPGREVGTDPVSGAKVTVKSGRFGPYVTDGEFNATLRQGDESTITIERAAEPRRAARQGPGEEGGQEDHQEGRQEDGEEDHQEGHRQDGQVLEAAPGRSSPSRSLHRHQGGLDRLDPTRRSRGGPVREEHHARRSTTCATRRRTRCRPRCGSPRLPAALIGLGLSSLGDWIGLLALTAMANASADSYAGKNYAIATVLFCACCRRWSWARSRATSPTAWTAGSR